MSKGCSTRFAPTSLPRVVLLAVIVTSMSLNAETKAQPPSTGLELDLSAATILAGNVPLAVEAKGLQILIEEVAARTAILLKSATGTKLDPKAPTIVYGTAASLVGTDPAIDARLLAKDKPTGLEGFSIEVSGSTVYVLGNSPRGALFAAGKLLRTLRLRKGRIAIPSTLLIKTSPRYAIRGHQLGYRPKTHSYDAWDLDQWDRYMRDLAVFGCNAVELVPPRTDDDADSPHFPRPPLEMMTGMSRIADSYDLDVWVWYPAMDQDYSNPETIDFAIKEWAVVYKALPRLDAIFVPGGDPGHTRPRDMFNLLEKQTAALKGYHPNAKMWMSPQSFNKEWFDEFLELVKKEPEWLGGIVWGPQVRVGLAELRALIPKRYPIRAYPDITHTINCQYPVADWDLAFALTYDREPINPRPLGEAAILRSYQDNADGFLTYSEGCNDDVNKFIWSAIGWDTSTSVVDALREFGRYFIGSDVDDAFAQALLALERNWQGPLITNDQVETTLKQFQDMEMTAKPPRLANWRFQQALFRAYYDAYIHDRLVYETALETEARAILRRSPAIGSLLAMQTAENKLREALVRPPAADLRDRIFQLGEALFQSIQMQMSVKRYQGIEIGRGTTLDTIDIGLNDREFLEAQFNEIRKLDDEPKRLGALEALLNRTNPGPGGFYDELGNLTRRPHLVQGATFADDPDFRKSPYTGFDTTPGLPRAWKRDGQTLWETPLVMKYDDLDPNASYRLRVVYSGEDYRPKVRLDADGTPVHPLMIKPFPPKPFEFDIPANLTADGALTLKFALEPGRGGNGRGCQVAEVWLIRKGR